jgi:hypothetical protein
MLVTPHYFTGVAESGYVSKGFRRFCGDYGMPITVIATSGLAYWGYFNGSADRATDIDVRADDAAPFAK